ncbi:adhesion G protein-coupled receptor L1-like [Lingula anatina]|uniref:Adhesion G protein-coupled receptor L1-like n=1 Tax=Lingula anatina TaxID=7574 RepID=A0A1S3IK61_LINAN|nr:adhesion G protein-coupled receptor L1-like [Lingula anatina]|eukprot:XP_013398630.2 adhesion G protein-coupled receptor L1-like [Lingula anatina]
MWCVHTCAGPILHPSCGVFTLVLVPYYTHHVCRTGTALGYEMPFITAHACEGSYLDLKCSNETLVLHIIRANYGRLSNSVCNEEGKAYSTDCLSPRAVRIVRQRCYRNNCSVPASNVIFSDPCSDTLKYLEVEYQCILAGNILFLAALYWLLMGCKITNFGDRFPNFVSFFLDTFNQFHAVNLSQSLLLLSQTYVFYIN